MKHYTEQQKSEIEYLINKGKILYKRLMKKTNATEADRLNSELSNVKHQLKAALNAEALFNMHIAEAKKHIAEAERIKAQYLRG